MSQARGLGRGPAVVGQQVGVEGKGLVGMDAELGDAQPVAGGLDGLGLGLEARRHGREHAGDVEAEHAVLAVGSDAVEELGVGVPHGRADQALAAVGHGLATDADEAPGLAGLTGELEVGAAQAEAGIGGAQAGLRAPAAHVLDLDGQGQRAIAQAGAEARTMEDLPGSRAFLSGFAADPVGGREADGDGIFGAELPLDGSGIEATGGRLRRRGGTGQRLAAEQ